MLYVIATPIGNLEDISYRALRILKEAELILAEDTRRTAILLNHYGIKNNMVSFNDHNKEKRIDKVMEMLVNGKEIAVVSDNGTPGISDPGFYIVRECVRRGVKVVPVPGASAFISALVCSGLPTDRFEFYGFLPKREKKIEELVGSIRSTAIFYESQYRLLKTLKIIAEKFPDYSVVVGRELTKKFEEFVRGSAKQVLQQFENKKIRGEIVIVMSRTGPVESLFS